MQIAGIILGCMLLGQALDATLPPPPGGEQKSPATLGSIIVTEGRGNEAPTAISSTPRRLKPSDMVAEAIVLPAGGALAGQPLTLLSALSSTADRRQQLEVTRTYWHLVQTVAAYHFCWNHAQEMGRIKLAGNEPGSLRLARASAAAMLSESEFEATRAQCELARLVRLPANAALPLPADRPLVGPYRTSFREMFAGRIAPEPAQLMERILPIRRQAIDDQAVAVQAAEDALAAVADDRQSGRADPTVWIGSSEELLRQQRAFVQSVCDYNRNIAEYSLTVAGPATNPQALTAMLIGPAQQPVAPVASGWADPRAVQPAGATEPITNPMRSRNEPTLAPPRDGWRTTEPTPAQPAGSTRKNEPTLAPPRSGLQPVGKNEPTLAPARDQFDATPASPPKSSVVPVESPSSTAQPRTTNKPISPLGEGQGEGTASPLYPALLDAAPAVRAKQLTVALHWDRSLPEGIGKPMSLADCMLHEAGADRRATIDAYWLLRQCAAEYQTLLQQTEMLDGLVAAVLDRRDQPNGATEMLRLRAAQTAAQAATRQSHVALVEAQYGLALRIGATADAAWPLASTIPHSGSYLLRLDAQPRSLVESWPIRRLAATIPGLGENVQRHAAAVVEADAARVAAAEKYRTGEAAVDQVLEGVARQTEQTLAFLNTLTEYNRAIAEYVLAVLPAATPSDKLVAALVVRP